MNTRPPTRRFRTPTPPSPAEQLAEQRAEKRPRQSREGVPHSREVIWKCHLRTIRQTLKLPLRTVARECGISLSAYHAIEAGTDLRLSTAHRIANFFGKPTHEIWNSPT